MVLAKIGMWRMSWQVGVVLYATRPSRTLTGITQSWTKEYAQDNQSLDSPSSFITVDAILALPSESIDYIMICNGGPG